MFHFIWFNFALHFILFFNCVCFYKISCFGKTDVMPSFITWAMVDLLVLFSSVCQCCLGGLCWKGFWMSIWGQWKAMIISQWCLSPVPNGRLTASVPGVCWVWSSHLKSKEKHSSNELKGPLEITWAIPYILLRRRPAESEPLRNIERWVQNRPSILSALPWRTHTKDHQTQVLAPWELLHQRQATAFQCSHVTPLNCRGYREVASGGQWRLFTQAESCRKSPLFSHHPWFRCVYHVHKVASCFEEEWAF